MGWTLTTFSLLAFFAAVILAALVGVVWRRTDDSRTFAALVTVVFVWAVVYGLQLGFDTESTQLLWQRVTLATSGLVPMLFFFFAVEYADRRDQVPTIVPVVLVVEWLLFATLTLSNPAHHLVWRQATLGMQSLSPVLDVQFAVGYHVHIIYAYSLVTVGIWLILSVYFRSAGVYRRQSMLILVGAVPAFVSHVLYTLKSSPIPGLDFTPFVFTFTGVVYGLALFHFDLLERTPVARQRAIELTGDGLVVVDESGHVVDSNRTARRIFDIDHTGATHVSAIFGTSTVRELHGVKTPGTVDGSRRVYELYVSELESESRPSAGFAVVLRDVTDQDAYEQRLEVTNRILRHNLRNDMNVIMGYADTLAENAATSEQRDRVDVISSTAERLVTLGEKARLMADIETTTHTAESVDVVSVLTTLVDEFREANPAVTVTTTYPDGEVPVLISKRGLSTALWNLLENTADHNDTSTLAVDVTVVDDDTQTLVTVRDNGVGLPEMEKDVLERRIETPLRHSNGLGLWLTNWILSACGGEISVETATSAGTAITLHFWKQDGVTEGQTGRPVESKRV